METLSYIALILLSLVGYSGGVVGKAGKSVEIKPQALDLFLLLFLWVAGIVSKSTFVLNKWLLILLWVVFAILLGACRAFFRKKTMDISYIPEKTENLQSGRMRKLWGNWEHFGYRMGTFQSRVLLSFLYFIVISPFALAVKWFSDPLWIKHRRQETHWHSRKEEQSLAEHIRRQY